MNDSKFKGMHPESLMMSYGYKPELSEGAIKCPIFQTSTFVFKTAEEGKAFFELAYGLREKEDTEEMGLIYSRLNNPDLEILENRLSLWDGADDSAVFDSGLAAITTTFFEFLKPGSLLVHSGPVYGGTDHFIHHVLDKFGVQTVSFTADDTKEEIVERIKASGRADKVGLVYIETPANPTNALIDIRMCREIADTFSKDENKVHVAVDNTYLGPVFQHPLKHGADVVLYSATKYIGGHSDVIAGACSGSAEVITRIKTMRTFLGNMAGPWTGWLLLRSLETLKIRMEEQARNARKVFEYLKDHPKVKKVYYLGDLEQGSRQAKIYQQQCESPGAMISFDIEGGEQESFRFLNALRLFKLAVSLGSTESLAQHPATMTHADVSKEHQAKLNITSALVRLSIGVENADDLILDIQTAFEKV